MHEIYAPREGFSITKYLQEWNKIENPQEVRVKFNPAVVKRVRHRYFFGVAEEPTADNGVIITFLVPALEVMVDWLLGFGPEVEILHPPQLQQMILEHAQKVVAHYATNSPN